MSTILVNTLTGKTAAGNVTITSEGGSATMQLQQGVAKAWITHQHGNTVDDSFNQSAITDSGTGDFTCNFSSNMSSATYIVPNCGATYENGVRGGMSVGMDHGGGATDNRATDHCDVSAMFHAYSSGNALTADVDWTMHIFFGDLA